MKTSNAILKWFNTDIESTNESQSEQISWIRLLPFIGLHLACFLVIYVGFSWLGLALAIVSYLVRMFAITAFYHRYFSHRTFKTNRIWQFVFAVLATCSVQRGPLWWAAHHRKHHKESDKDLDLHSPVKRSFLWSHIGWFCCDKNFKTNYKSIKDFSKYPELVFLNRYDMLVPVLYGAAIYLFGLFLGSAYMGFNITGGQAFVWGFLISTIVLFHATVSINSLAHLFGKKNDTQLKIIVKIMCGLPY
jgi:stearoyl-CoA desaturase (delta-9 desaturase)